jgi:hypothetical protein
MVKSYTDLEQSKKLIESGIDTDTADMCYKCIGEDPYDVVLRPYSEWKEEYKGLLVGKEVDVVPCWSLAALLGVLPDYTLQTNTDGTVFVFCDSKRPMVSGSYSDPVDACYEMILKLHDLNLL